MSIDVPCRAVSLLGRLLHREHLLVEQLGKPVSEEVSGVSQLSGRGFLGLWRPFGQAICHIGGFGAVLLGDLAAGHVPAEVGLQVCRGDALE